MVHGERLREEALVFDNNIEELPKDDERVVVGLRAVEVGGLGRFLEDRVQEVWEADEREALVELLEGRGCV